MHDSPKKANFANVIQLERHIEILLLDNDCVIVPDFGGFMAHHVDAKYDEKDALFLPPQRTIGFNPQLKMNDSLLAQSYAEAYDLSYPEALTRIESEVNELRQHLANEGSYVLNDIGTLYLNEDGNYIFEPCEAGLLTPELYGLSSFDIQPLARLVPISEAANREEKGKVISLSEDSETKRTQGTETGPHAETTLEAVPKVQVVSIKVSLLRNLAAACIAVVVFLLVSTPLGSNDTAHHLLKSNMDTGLLTRIMPKDVSKTLSLSAIKKKNDSQSPLHKDPEHTAAKTDLTPQKAPYYCIVLASKVTRSNAEHYVKKLEEKGYTEARVFSRKGMNTKVIYGKYPNEHKAYNTLNRLKNEDAFSEGWVLKIRESEAS